jgi:hypothetical protein
MGRIISDKFQAEKIEFPYEEIEIGLVFLPPEEKNEKYREWYNKLPYYYRGKNMVRVSLSVLEKEKTLADVFKFIYGAFDVIISKKKKGDAFDTEKLKSTLENLEKELESADLWELDAIYENIWRQETIEANRQDRITREQSAIEKKKLIYDLRFMYSLPNTGLRYFSPYETRFCDRILDKLRAKKFRLPGYTHLYIQVSDSFENALFHATRPLNWFVYGIAVFENYTDYPTMREVDKKRVVFDLIKQGLNDIAAVDKLDTKILDEALDEAEHEIFKKYKYLDKK